MTMKKLILISIGVLFCTSLFSQTLSNNFELDENQNIIWRTINNTELDFKSLVEAIDVSFPFSGQTKNRFFSFS